LHKHSGFFWESPANLQLLSFFYAVEPIAVSVRAISTCVLEQANSFFPDNLF